MEKGDRKNDEKLKWSLVNYKALIPMVQVLWMIDILIKI